MRKLGLALILWLVMPLSVHAASDSSDFWTGDTRLDHKITCKLRHTTVSTVLATLQTLSGVKLRAGYNKADWQVRDRKMDIFVRDMPIGDLMQSIARVMKFKWDRSILRRAQDEGGVYSYRLFMDRKTLLEAEGQAYREEERHKKELADKRSALLDKLPGIANVSPAELAKLKDDNPMLYALAESGAAGPLHRFLSECPAARDALVNKQEFELVGSSLSSAGQEAMFAAMRGFNRISARMGHTEDLPDSLGEGSVSVKINPESMSAGSDAMAESLFSRFTLGEVRFSYRGADRTESAECDLPILDPDSAIGKALGKVLAGGAEPDKSADGTAASVSVKLQPDELEKTDFGEPTVKHPDDKEPSKQIELGKDDKSKAKGPYETLEDILEDVAAASGMNIIADSYGKCKISLGLSGKMPVRAVLEMASMICSRNWWVRADTVELRDRYWFRKRSLQVPEAYMDKWRAAFVKNGTLEIDTLAEIAQLAGDGERYAANIANDDVLGCQEMLFAVRYNWKVLQLYASLSESQRAEVFSTNGLSDDSLTDAQLQLASKLHAGWTRGSGLRLKCERRSSDRGFSYVFTGPGGSWFVSSPRYQPPKTPPQPSPEAGGSR